MSESSNHISRVKFWHLRSVKKFDTYKDQLSHSLGNEWQTQVGQLIPPMNRTERESFSPSHSKCKHELTSSTAHSHVQHWCVTHDTQLSSGKGMSSGGGLAEQSAILSLDNNTTIDVKGDCSTVLSTSIHWALLFSTRKSSEHLLRKKRNSQGPIVVEVSFYRWLQTLSK